MVWLGLAFSFLVSSSAFAEAPNGAEQKYVKKCLSTGRGCAYTLRYQATPTTIHAVATKLHSVCMQASGGERSAQGASECSILGAYYLKHRNFDKAIEVLRKDCEGNAQGCLLLSTVLDRRSGKSEATESAAKFCDIALNSDFTDHSMFRLARKQCPSTNGGRLGSRELFSAGDSILKGYFHEQKR